MKNIDVDNFRQQYWQQKPLVIRQAFPDFQDLLDEHELAGLAMEDEFDSRIIRKQNGNWFVEQGPFESFDDSCQGAWTLLVQGVESALPDAQPLLSQFDFVPSWRLDDLMVSFSVEGAGVGPHVDQYDVFIIQGKGSRRWQVGDNSPQETLRPHPALKQVPDFAPIIDEVLYPGDVIYIPPGFPHNGTALAPCLNYSVGFRAPNQTEMLSSFTDFLIDHDIKTKRYADPKLQSRTYQSEIKPQEVDQFQQLLQQMVNSDHFYRWLVAFQSRTPEDPSYFEAVDYSEQEIAECLNNDFSFERLPNVRVAHLRSEQPPAHIYIGVNGLAFQCDDSCSETLLNFINSSHWFNQKKIFYKNGSLFVQIVSKLVNEGYWIINQK
ncbi:MAG: cupin domain-containing protein [Aestuariibacter sp.]